MRRTSFMGGVSPSLDRAEESGKEAFSHFSIALRGLHLIPVQFNNVPYPSFPLNLLLSMSSLYRVKTM